MLASVSFLEFLCLVDNPVLFASLPSSLVRSLAANREVWFGTECREDVFRGRRVVLLMEGGVLDEVADLRLCLGWLRLACHYSKAMRLRVVQV